MKPLLSTILNAIGASSFLARIGVSRLRMASTFAIFRACSAVSASRPSIDTRTTASAPSTLAFEFPRFRNLILSTHCRQTPGFQTMEELYRSSGFLGAPSEGIPATPTRQPQRRRSGKTRKPSDSFSRKPPNLSLDTARMRRELEKVRVRIRGPLCPTLKVIQSWQ
jgi:hypothetical protein